MGTHRFANLALPRCCVNRLLQHGFMHVVSLRLAKTWVAADLRGREHPLPAPVPIGVRVLTRQTHCGAPSGRAIGGNPAEPSLPAQPGSEIPWEFPHSLRRMPKLPAVPPQSVFRLANVPADLRVGVGWVRDFRGAASLP